MSRHTIAPFFLLLVVLLTALPTFTGIAQPSATISVYLPLMSSGRNPANVLGLEITRMPSDTRMSALRPAWVRRNGLLWSDVESRSGRYSWDVPSVRSLEADLIQIGSLGLEPVLVVRNSPSWALQIGSSSCGPITPEGRSSFARFMAAAVERYSKPPYNVRYWEIGNEPDAPLSAGQQPYGCWGIADDPYYGGQDYGALLKAVYPAIKAADPRARVLNGGLLLNQPYSPNRSASLDGRFLEGMLVAGAGNSFDILAYHSYSYYNGTPDGGAGSVDWKPAYLRGILARYGLSKPLFNSEGALLCSSADATCHIAQANAIPRIYMRTMRDQVIGFVWYVYDNDSFHSTALIEPGTGLPRPAYQAYAQLHTILAAYDYIGPLSNLPPGAEGYRLGRGAEQAIVIWANSSLSVNIPLSGVQNLRCEEIDGTPAACALGADGTLSIEAGIGARYIRFKSP